MALMIPRRATDPFGVGINGVLWIFDGMEISLGPWLEGRERRGVIVVSLNLSRGTLVYSTVVNFVDVCCAGVARAVQAMCILLKHTRGSGGEGCHAFFFSSLSGPLLFACCDRWRLLVNCLLFSLVWYFFFLDVLKRGNPWSFSSPHFRKPRNEQLSLPCLLSPKGLSTSMMLRTRTGAYVCRWAPARIRYRMYHYHCDVQNCSHLRGTRMSSAAIC